MLHSLGRAYPAHLARVAGVDRGRLFAIMHGRPPAFRSNLSLVALGLAARSRDEHGLVYEITPRGRRKARQLASRERRPTRA